MLLKLVGATVYAGWDTAPWLQPGPRRPGIAWRRNNSQYLVKESALV